MRAAAVVWLLAAVVLAGCGAKKTPLAQTARPCLKQLGTYVHHRPEQRIGIDKTPRLPLLDPDNPPRRDQLSASQQLAWPDDFQEWGEVSFPPDRPGANDVQVFIFGDETMPKRIAAATRRAREIGAFFQPSGAPPLKVLGPTLVQWSSTPTRRQRAAVVDCLTA